MVGTARERPPGAVDPANPGTEIGEGRDRADADRQQGPFGFVAEAGNRRDVAEVGRARWPHGVDAMREISALLALEIDVEEGLVAPGGYDLAGDRRERRPAEILHQAKIGREREFIDLPAVPFGVSVTWNVPDFANWIDRAGNSRFVEDGAQQKHVKGNLGLVKRARRPRRLDVDKAKMRAVLADLAANEVSEASPHLEIRWSPDKGRPALGP